MENNRIIKISLKNEIEKSKEIYNILLDVQKFNELLKKYGYEIHINRINPL